MLIESRPHLPWFRRVSAACRKAVLNFPPVIMSLKACATENFSGRETPEAAANFLQSSSSSETSLKTQGSRHPREIKLQSNTKGGKVTPNSDPINTRAQHDVRGLPALLYSSITTICSLYKRSTTILGYSTILN